MPKLAPAAATLCFEGLPYLHPNAAGFDIGGDEIYLCVPPNRDPYPVRAFATFTADLHALADWLEQSGIDTVARESPGIYWLPLCAPRSASVERFH
jgi:transposase